MRATDGFGYLRPAPSLTPRPPRIDRFCLDASTFWVQANPQRAPSDHRQNFFACCAVLAQRLLRTLLP